MLGSVVPIHTGTRAPWLEFANMVAHIRQHACFTRTESVRGSSTIESVQNSRSLTNRQSRANIPFGKQNKHDTDPARALAPAKV